MKSRIGLFTMIVLAATFIATPARIHAQQAVDAQQHEQHHPADAAAPPAPPKAQATPAPQAGKMSEMAGMMTRMRANDAKLDELVTKMNAAQGTAKTEAIAAVLTALVEDHKSGCEPMMANMMSMMNMMGGNSGVDRTQGAPVPRR